MRGTDGSYFSFLEHSQQLRLKLQRHVSDFVEENDAFVAGPENAQASARRAGERAALVTEQLTFSKRWRERCAVDWNERLIATAAQSVEKPGPDLFSSACLASKKDRAANLSRAFGVMRHPLYRGVATNN
jgi:hypothetical protein